MKKIYSLLLLVITSVSFGQTFYSENVGTATGTLAISANTFEAAAPITYSGDADTRATAVSSGYNGASAGRNVFFAASGARFFQISGLNTSAYTTANLQLSFGYLTTQTTVQMIVEYSTNGTTWSPITFSNNTTTSWNLVTIPGGVIPSSTTLSIRFTAPATSGGMRIDDIKLSNVSASCTLALGTPTTLCNASTENLDTYNVTIPFTGGGNATYVITPLSGTVSGDNPSTTATGNIIISNVTEGTNFSATITGGTCNLSSTALSPECKPVNTLPYSESFNYTVGSSLGSSQKWTNVNTGDNIVVSTGSLSYTGVTSSANSVAFTGSGIDCFTPFTTTTSGTIFASFIVNITDLSNVTTDGSFTYFAGLTDDVKGYNARLFVKKTGTQYQLGLDTASTTTNYDATLRNAGSVVLVVLGYDFATNSLKAWFNPNLATFNAATTPTLTNTPATAYTNLGGFILRQDGDTNTPSITFDELRIATTTAQLLSVGENTISGLNVYPNPVKNGVFYITTDANAERTVTVFDVVGKQVLNTTTSESAINVANLNSGVYIVKITEEGKTATKKLVIR